MSNAPIDLGSADDIETVIRLETMIEPLVRYLSAPGYWGYHTLLGNLTQDLFRVQAAIAARKRELKDLEAERDE